MHGLGWVSPFYRQGLYYPFRKDQWAGIIPTCRDSVGVVLGGL